MSDPALPLVQLKAQQYGFVQPSERKTKRFKIILPYNKVIHFGLKKAKTYVDHGDEAKRKAWRARMEKVTDDDGNFVYQDQTSPLYWSYHLLW